MTITTATCHQCGFEVNHVSFGKKGRMSLDVAEWAMRCEERQGSQPGNCPHLNAQLEQMGLPTYRG